MTLHHISSFRGATKRIASCFGACSKHADFMLETGVGNRRKYSSMWRHQVVGAIQPNRPQQSTMIQQCPLSSPGRHHALQRTCSRNGPSCNACGCLSYVLSMALRTLHRIGGGKWVMNLRANPASRVRLAGSARSRKNRRRFVSAAKDLRQLDTKMSKVMRAMQGSGLHLDVGRPTRCCGVA